MLTPPTQAASTERQLLRLFRGLPETEREALLAFAEFLSQRAAPAQTEPQPSEPLPIPRPARESVVAAIKRLSHSYAMLDRGILLDETSTLMSAHVLQGRPAAEVIDELEALFARHYEAHRAQPGRDG